MGVRMDNVGIVVEDLVAAIAFFEDHRVAPVNAMGYLRVMFEVDDLDDTLERLAARGATLVSSEVVDYEHVYRLCYVRGPEGILLGLSQDISGG